MIHLPEELLRKTRNYFSRSKWLMSLLKLPHLEQKQQKPGIILIQIDAVPKKQLQRALNSSKMPFLKKLIDKQVYKLHTHYSGMPCSTPSVQGELFYGVKSCVPAFSFYNKKHKRVFTMFRPDDASAIESELKEKAQGLLKGGSCYSNIFTGDADESHFCIADLGFANIFKSRKTLSFIILILLHFLSLIRAAFLLIIEAVLAVIGFFKGVLEGRGLWQEFKFILSRVGMCVLLRELIVIGAGIDIARNIPIIHINLMGYHEQSHRRGASSRLAQWALKGADNSIKRIWKSANRSAKHYEIWIYSDHGQADSVSYFSKYGEFFSEKVREALKSEQYEEHLKTKRLGFLNHLGWHIEEFLDKGLEAVNIGEKNIIVTETGPCAHIYLDDEHLKDKEKAANKLLETRRVPLILIPQKNKKILALTPFAQYHLPEQTEFLANNFMPKEFISDLTQACCHPNAGDLIAMGYEGTKKLITFARECGSHGSLSEQEYSGFFLAPNHCNISSIKGYVRPVDIRNAALQILHKTDENTVSMQPSEKKENTFRLMTYNVHNCKGMDGKLLPLRIAKVIEQFKPDIVALQELDVLRERSENQDQAKIIADILQMDHFFSPAMTIEKELYGDAILSRFPMKLVKADVLPCLKQSSRREPRGALWVEIEIANQKLQIINTHLGLTPKERTQQIKNLLDTEWIGKIDPQTPTILCGDLNFGTRSKLYKRCCEKLKPVKPNSKLTKTFCGRYPFVQIDHIFYNEHIVQNQCIIGDTDRARIASDHRPLIAEFELRSTS